MGNDPRKLRGIGGVFNPSTLGLYTYTYNNPVVYIDPDGREGEFVVFWGLWAAATADAAVPDPSDAGAPIKVPLYAAALAGAAVGGTISYGINWVLNESDEAAADGAAEKEHQGSTGPIRAPDELPAFPDAKPAKPKTPVQGGGGKRKRWKDKKKRIYEWDSQHGIVEQYDKTGKKHLGEFDPNTGEQLKPGDKTLQAEP